MSCDTHRDQALIAIAAQRKRRIYEKGRRTSFGNSTEAVNEDSKNAVMCHGVFVLRIR